MWRGLMFYVCLFQGQLFYFFHLPPQPEVSRGILWIFFRNTMDTENNVRLRVGNVYNGSGYDCRTVHTLYSTSWESESRRPYL